MQRRGTENAQRRRRIRAEPMQVICSDKAPPKRSKCNSGVGRTHRRCKTWVVIDADSKRNERKLCCSNKATPTQINCSVGVGKCNVAALNWSASERLCAAQLRRCHGPGDSDWFRKPADRPKCLAVLPQSSPSPSGISANSRFGTSGRGWPLRVRLGATAWPAG